MNIKPTIALHLALFTAIIAHSQTDTLRTRTYPDLIIHSTPAPAGMGTLGEEKNGWIYSGKKTELLNIDSIDGNKATNNTRELIGRIPGLNVVETESEGFVSNGIGFRGLNPMQSQEINVRQNGYNIAGDVMGYNEVYYLPPSEAIERVEVVRGAGSLQYGPQFGGMINYITEQAPTDKRFALHSAFTAGSYGLLNVFSSIGGTVGKFNYYAMMQYRHSDGYRANSGSNQGIGMAHIGYAVSKKVNLSFEYSLLENKIQMPGGLTDSLYQLGNSKLSTRPRNWISTPWHLFALNAHWDISPQTAMNLNIIYGHKKRELVWRNQDGGTIAPDTIDHATGSFIPREVEQERMDNGTAELRLITHYRIKGVLQTLAAGIRASYSAFHNQHGGIGTTGMDMNLTIDSTGYQTDEHYANTNLAVFAENSFHIGKRLSITPGVRVEYLHSSVSYTAPGDTSVLTVTGSRSRAVFLAGLGLQLHTTTYSALYANVARAYRPIDYSSLLPFGVSSKVDPNLHDASGYNSEIGYRGNWRNKVLWDINVYALYYQDKLGTVLVRNVGDEYTLRTNVSSSLHIGIESYIEIDLIRLITEQSKAGRFNVFNSLAYTHARYLDGVFKDKAVEYAPEIIERVGLRYQVAGFSLSAQMSYQSSAFGDATNAETSINAIAGRVPSYYVIDCAASYRIGAVQLRAGIDNLTAHRYFTLRADEYPGPGIIPAIGRNVYVGLALRL